MDVSRYIPLIGISAFWFLVAVGGPILIPKGTNRGLIQTMIIMTSICCYLFWLIVYLAQLNALYGPRIDTSTIRVIQMYWNPFNQS